MAIRSIFRKNRCRESAFGMKGAATAAVVLLGLVLAPQKSAGQPSSTTVTPAGQSFHAALSAGTLSEIIIQGITVRCTSSTSIGRVPPEPDNHNPAGPVTISLSPPTFSSGGGCSTSVPLLHTTTTTNEDNGPWQLMLQYDPAGTIGTLIIPQAGIANATSGLATCTVIVAPDGPATLVGKFIDATMTTPPRLDLSTGASLPIRVSGGFGCPTSATSATVRVSYDITPPPPLLQNLAVGP